MAPVFFSFSALGWSHASPSDWQQGSGGKLSLGSEKSPHDLSPGAVSHSRTHSSPSDLLSEVELAQGEGPLMSSPGKKAAAAGTATERNFADFSRDKLTVHQDLLVSRDPRRDSAELVAVGGGNGVVSGGVIKSASFRRQRVRGRSSRPIIVPYKINSQNGSYSYVGNQNNRNTICYEYFPF